MVDYFNELSEILQDDGIFSEIRGSNIDSKMDESLKNLKFSHIEADYFQGLKAIDSNPSQRLNAFLGGNRTGKSSIINAFAFCLNADISDMLSHGFGEGTIKATFTSNGEEGMLSYNLFNKDYKFTGSEPMTNSLRTKSEEFKLLVWRHKTNISNFFYRKNRDTTISLIETSRWTNVANFLIERKKESTQKMASLQSEIRDLGQLQSTELIREEIDAVECEIQSVKEKMESIATEIRSSLSLRRENDEVDFDSVRDMLRANEMKVHSLRSSQRDLIIQFREYNRLIHMAPAHLLINEHLTSPIIHCPMCNERLERRPNRCPVCGTENEVNFPVNIELMALQECAFTDRDRVKSEIDTFETEISELEAENQTYCRIIEEKAISEDTIGLESQLEEVIINSSKLKTRKNALIHKLEYVDSINRLIEEKKAAIEALLDKTNRYETTITRLLSFDKDTFREQLKDIWFELWSKMFKDDYSEWDITVTDQLGVSVRAPDGRIYGSKDRNPGSEEDILSMTYQVAIIKTLVYRGWNPTYRIFLMDGPFEGIDDESHNMIAEIMEELSSDLGFQVIFTSRLFAANFIKETFNEIEIQNISEITTPYTPMPSRTIENWGTR